MLGASVLVTSSRVHHLMLLEFSESYWLPEALRVIRVLGVIRVIRVIVTMQQFIAL